MSGNGSFREARSWNGTRTAEPVRMTGTYLDIGERKHAEEALRESEERYRTVAEFTYDWEYWADPEGNLLYISPACERVTGYSAQEFLDNPHLLQTIVYSDDLPDVKKHFHEVRTYDRDSLDSLDFRIVHRNGEVRWINHACRPVHGKGGRPLGRRACNRDVTDRKTFEAALVDNEARYRALFENMRNGVAIYEAVDNGEDFVFVDFNKAAEIVSGLSRDQVIGKRISDVFPGVTESGLFGVLQKTWLTGEPTHHPVNKYQDERIEIWVENFVYKLPSGEIVAVFSDETERKLAEEALRESEEKYRQVVDKAQEAILIAQDGMHRFVNPKAVELWAYSKEELLSKPFAEFIHPDDREMVRSLHIRRMQGEEIPNRYTFRILRKDGTARSR